MGSLHPSSPLTFLPSQNRTRPHPTSFLRVHLWLSGPPLPESDPFPFPWDLAPPRFTRCWAPAPFSGLHPQLPRLGASGFPHLASPLSRSPLPKPQTLALTPRILIPAPFSQTRSPNPLTLSHPNHLSQCLRALLLPLGPDLLPVRALSVTRHRPGSPGPNTGPLTPSPPFRPLWGLLPAPDPACFPQPAGGAPLLAGDGGGGAARVRILGRVRQQVAAATVGGGVHATRRRTHLGA